MLLVFFSPLPNIDFFLINVSFILAAIKLTSGLWFIFSVFRITEKGGWLMQAIVKKHIKLKVKIMYFKV